MQGSRQCLRRLLLAALQGQGGGALPAGDSLPAAAALLNCCTSGPAAYTQLWGPHSLGSPAWRLVHSAASLLDASPAGASPQQEALGRDDFEQCIEYLHAATGTSLAEAHRLLNTVLTTNFKSGGQMYAVDPRRPVSLAREVRPVVELLASLPGVDVRRALRNSPWVLIDTAAEGMAANAALLRGLLGLTQLELGKLLTANANPLRQDLSTTVQPAVEYLRSLGLPPADVRLMVLRFPRLIQYSVATIAALVAALERLGLQRAEAGRVLVKFPALVSVAPEGKLQQVVGWMESQGLDEGQVRSTLLRYPNIASLSIHDNLDVTAALLAQELGCGQAVVGKVLVTAPDTFGRSAARLRHNAEVAARVLGLDAAGLSKLLAANPGLLRCDLSSPRYAAKLAFLGEALGREAGPAMALNPMYLTYGLTRIVTRGLYLQAKGRPTHSVTSWLGAVEDKFLKFAGGDSADYSAFLRALPLTAAGRRWMAAPGWGGAPGGGRQLAL